MSEAEYKKLWDDNVGPHTPEPMPPYSDYLVRENMVEDFIDIFRGRSTREERSAKEGIKWYYPHPFFNADGSPKLAKKPCIKYIMIAEAAPTPKPVVPVDGCLIPGGDDNNTYFYNILHLKRTNYLNSPRTSFACPPYRPCPENKIDTLLSLAFSGYLLLDLFPFATAFTTAIRTSLNIANTTRLFWDNTLISFSILNRLNRIAGLLCHDWDMSMIAPNTISEYIVDPINGFPTLALIPAGIHPTNFRDTNINPTRATNWRKITVSKAGAPSSTLITISF